MHWRRLVKNIGWANQNIGGQKVVKVINAWAFLNYWGHVPGLPPKSTPMKVRNIFCKIHSIAHTYSAIGVNEPSSEVQYPIKSTQDGQDPKERPESIGR